MRQLRSMSVFYHQFRNGKVFKFSGVIFFFYPVHSMHFSMNGVKESYRQMFSKDGNVGDEANQ